jgi:arylsulfatase
MAAPTKLPRSTASSENWQDNLKHIDELGGPKHYNHFPAAWAWAMDTPFQWTKQIASHFGGHPQSARHLVAGAIKDKGGVRTQFHHVIDVMPTILEAAGIRAPESLNGHPTEADRGVSMVLHLQRREGAGAPQDADLRAGI